MSAENNRIIAHFDLDSFFVSVEVINNPSLKGKPVIVGGGERGVVAACSYEARKYGLHSAMPMKTALRLCPQAIVIGGSRGEYSKYSRMVTAIIADKAPLFEKASIDEFYIDLTGMQRFFDPFQWTVDLRQSVIDQTGLPISFGLASSKMVAKIATDEAKPNGYLHILPGKEKEFLAPLRVNKIPGVGQHMYQTLRDLGIETIRDLAGYAPEILERQLGKAGPELWLKAQGIHHTPVQPYQEAKSVSTENTFDKNISDPDVLQDELVKMTEKIAYEMRQDNKMAGCVSVKIRYPDFETTSKQTTIPYTFYDDELIPVVRDLFQKLYRPGTAVRLIGVRLSELTDEAVQTNLFNDAGKKAGLYKAIDDLKNRYGRSSVTKATGKKPDNE